jgi:hypothetical protein
MARDRKTTTKERQNPTHPLPPLNANAQWSFATTRNAVDLYWDDPALVPNNSSFDILGVNVYRSFDSEFGPYHRLNTNPIGATYYQDITSTASVNLEDVSSRFVSRNDEAGQWIFKVQNYPIVKINDPKTIANSLEDVTIFIDGQEVKAARVYGETGEVVLQTSYRYDPATNEQMDPILPHADSVVLCSYEYNTNLLESDLYKRTFYRITTVGYDQWDGELKETPLDWAEAKHIHQMENLDYIWREAIRRNRWILDQGGERVKAFIHKYRGVQCTCFRQFDDPQPYNQCTTCFGTGIKGGYEGPYDILLAPADAERTIRQSDKGRAYEMVYDAWTGPHPLLSQRDFIVKLNGDRYSLGPVRMPNNRGNILQQHFNVALFDSQDIRSKVPILGTDSLAFPETRTADWDDDPDELRYPQITDKEGAPDGIEERGRTPVWENINY